MLKQALYIDEAAGLSRPIQDGHVVRSALLNALLLLLEEDGLALRGGDVATLGVATLVHAFGGAGVAGVGQFGGGAFEFAQILSSIISETRFKRNDHRRCAASRARE